MIWKDPGECACDLVRVKTVELNTGEFRDKGALSLGQDPWRQGWHSARVVLESLEEAMTHSGRWWKNGPSGQSGHRFPRGPGRLPICEGTR